MNNKQGERSYAESETKYSGFRGLKIISPNIEYYVINGKMTQGHVVNGVEAVGENWIVS